MDWNNVSDLPSAELAHERWLLGEIEQRQAVGGLARFIESRLAALDAAIRDKPRYVFGRGEPEGGEPL
ncbi:MAG: hypothetical protein Q8K99_05635 [Actinomycetota bacterium]|nr:hypothetical protein [Actinomycetota bacterium]